MLRRVQARAAFAPSVAVTAFGAHQANGMFKKQKNAIQKHNKHVRVQFVTATEVKEHANNKKKSVGEDLTVPAPNPYTVVTPASYPTGFRGTAGEVSVREAPKSPVTVFSGLGSRGQITDYRQAVTAAVRQGKKLGATHAVLHPPTTPITTCDGLWTAPSVLSPAKVAEKTALYGVTAAYQYDRLVTKAIDGSNHNQTKSTREIKASSKKQPKRDFSIAVASSETAAVKRGTAIGRCITDCRNLGNLREDEGVPLYYKEWIQRNVARLPGVRVRTVLVGDQLRRAGLNLLHNVGKGSRHPPCMMVLEYIGDKRSKESLALVGKGVTFDCGGLNVKPYGAMETMHTDMMGAATAVTTLKCVAELGLKVNVSCTVGFVENAIGPDSYHPSTIIKSLKGLEVEVTNTDAEGRLILADMLTYVQNYARLRLAPTRIIDLATLTGAIIISLGNHRAGLFSNQTELSTALYQSGCHTGELVWPMPVGEEHAQLMRRKMADLVNAAPGRAGGSCSAAAFLQYFIDNNRPWAHLDIAGVADNGETISATHPAGVTGFGVELLMDFLEPRKKEPAMAVIPPSVKATSPSKKTTKKAKKLTKQQKKVALRIIKKLKKAPQGKITIKPATKADKKKIRKIKKLQTSTKAPTRKAVLLAKQKKSKKTKKATKRPVTDPLLTKKLVSKPIEHEALVVRQIMSEFLPDEKLKKSDSKGMRAVLSLTKKGGKIPDEETILKQFEQEAKKGKTVKKVNKKKK